MKIGVPCDHLGTCKKRQRVEKEEEEEDVNEKVEEEEEEVDGKYENQQVGNQSPLAGGEGLKQSEDEDSRC